MALNPKRHIEGIIQNCVFIRESRNYNKFLKQMVFSIKQLQRIHLLDEEKRLGFFIDSDCARTSIEEISSLIHDFAKKFPGSDLILGPLWVSFLPYYPMSKQVVIQKGNCVVSFSSKKARALAEWILKTVPEE
jgi:hypothetical protein